MELALLAIHILVYVIAETIQQEQDFKRTKHK